MIRKEGDKWILYTKDGSKKLGTHDTEEDAKKQEAAIEIAKHVRHGEELRVAIGSTDSGALRTTKYRGHECLVVPVIALMEGVIHAVNADTPEFVPVSELAHAPQGWNGRPVVPGHPAVGTVRISANAPAVLESQKFGEVFDACMDGSKLKLNAYLDKVRARELGGDAQAVIDRLEAGETVEVSVGAYVTAEAGDGTHNGRAYRATWRRIVPDHLALLPKGATGACSVEMGCGAPRAAELTTAGGPGSGWTAEGGHVPGSQGGDVRSKADEASGKALDASSKAMSTGTVEDHTAAVAAHAVAMGEHSQTSTGAAAAEYHQQQVVHHTDAIRKIQEQQRRAFEGHGGTKTPREGDRVKVMGKVIGAGKVGIVSSSDSQGSFHNVKTPNGKSIGSYHSSDLKVMEEAGRHAEGSTMREKLRSVIQTLMSLFKTTESSDVAKEEVELVDLVSSMFQLEPDESTRYAAGRRNSAADQAVIQTVHDHAVKLGAECVGRNVRVMEAPRLTAAEEAAYRALTLDLDFVKLRTGYEGAHPFTFCMEHVVPAIEEKGGTVDDPERFCGWWKDEQKYTAAETAPRYMAAVTDKSFDDRTSAVNAAVQKKFGTTSGLYPSNTWAQSVFEDYVIVRKDDKLYKVSYKIGADGEVELGAESTEVKMAYVTAEAMLEPVQKIAAAPEEVNDGSEHKKEMHEPEHKAAELAVEQPAVMAAQQQPCGCISTGDKAMTTEQRAEAIKTLTACKHSGFTAGDQKMLEQATDERLESFLVAAEARKKEVEAVKAEPKVLTEEDFMKVAPPALKSLLVRQQRQETEYKTDLVAALKVAQDEYSEAELAAMSIEQLARMAKVARVEEKPDYAGRGLPRILVAKDKDVYANPPDPYAPGLAALKAAAVR